VLLSLPAGGLAEFVTRGYIRVGTTLGLFVALAVLDVPVGRTVGAGRLAAFAALLTLTLLADSFTLFIGVVPVLIVSALGSFRVGSRGGIKLWPVAVAASASVGAAYGLSWLIEALGGYRVVPSQMLDFTTYREPWQLVLRNGLVLAENLPSLYRCGPPAELSGQAIAVWLGCLIGPVLLLLALIRGSPVRFRGRHPAAGRPADFVGDVLWFSTVLGLAAFLASSVPKDRGTIRYMIPSVLSGAVLTGRVLAQRVQDARPWVVALVLLGASYAFTVRDDLRKPPAAEPAVQLADLLARQGLRHGYGPFWDASIVTVSSGGRVAVRPISVRPLSPTSHMIVSMKWMADARWFAEGPATFVVLEPGPKAAYQFGVTERNCVVSFGAPAKRYELGPYAVLVWDHDLRPQLDRDPRSGGPETRPPP
jgi:hypothetical protein